MIRIIMNQNYVEYAVEKTMELLAIDSPTGYTKKAADWVKDTFRTLGYQAFLTNKGGVVVDLGGKDDSDGLLLQAHIDTLGGMVAEVKANGRLKITNLGGLRADNCETENVRIYTREGKVYEGTCQLINPSTHVNKEYSDTKRTFDTVEIVIDEDVNNAEETRKLGIDVGDFVCFEPRSRVTESGYIKSRFLDDKLSVGILLAFAKYLKDKKMVLKRHTYAHITVYEEVGHGGSANIYNQITEVLAIDMGCVGLGIQGSEKKVSICAKDTKGPYSYEMVSKLVAAAKKNHADYAIDVYPNYGSDAEAAIVSGLDVRHGLIGVGTFASHGYERCHKDGVKNVLLVLKGYLGIEDE